MLRHGHAVSALAAAALLAGCGDPDALRLPDNGDSVVGAVIEVEAAKDTTAEKMARRYGVSAEELARANGLDAGSPVKAGTRLLIPTRYVLPDAPRDGIVVNIAEMRLYHFRRSLFGKPEAVASYPAAVGREEWETPTGQTEVAEKIVDPKWHPPQSIRQEQSDDGKKLPAVVPAGPDNPLGKHALRLGWKKHLIHGTNAPSSIGRAATHGCIRLYPEDMARLFDRVREGTPVTLVDQPVKVGVLAGRLYLEAHSNDKEAVRPALARIREWVRGGPGRRIDWHRVDRALKEPTGVPVAISLGKR